MGYFERFVSEQLILALRSMPHIYHSPESYACHNITLSVCILTLERSEE